VSEDAGVEVIVVGAGPAGLACALTLARKGVGVLVVERGDPAGAKNLSGGRLYLGPLAPLAPGLLDGAPFERLVTRERLTLLTAGSSTEVTHGNPSLGDGARRSYTVLRARLDGWLADQVTEAGGSVVTGARVDGLLRDEAGRVRGVVTAGEELEARVVVAADGALSFLGREAGLRPDLDAAHFALGVKALYGLPAGAIEDRFCLEPGEGAAELMIGEVTGGLPGGAFLYTNRETVGLGVVVRLDALGRSTVEASELIDGLERRPEIARRLAGGELLEYGAHLVPEVSGGALGPRAGDGLLLVGDAAGTVVNHGITVRGMDLAIASGVIAAEAVAEALAAGDVTRAGLSRYEARLGESFVGRDLARFAGAADVLARPFLGEELPRLAGEMLEELFSFGPGPKERLSRIAWRHLRRRVLRAGAARELWRLRRL
jgi:electron transfer flavoprotein-quinone oxidoreductase